MFDRLVYIERRKKLKAAVNNGVIFLPGNSESPMNYADNTYKFRQDSNFLYYFGLEEDNVYGVIDLNNDTEILFANNREIDDVVWMGADKTVAEKCELIGVEHHRSTSELKNYLREQFNSSRKLHFLPQYRAESKIQLGNFLELPASFINDHASEELIKAIVKQRSIKSPEEIKEIEEALAISYDMNLFAMKNSKSGIVEREISGAVEGIALSKGNGISFPVIFSVHGETLHNHHHHNVMHDGDLAVLDSGAESLHHYASDITRTFPVSGKYTDKQAEIYQTVLDAQMAAIEMIKPGVLYKDVHLKSAEVITVGLQKAGLMQGDVAKSVSSGAHALFFPHGLGHMLGLDVHDLEGLGENYVGYDNEIKRSSQFGLAYLRFAKELKPGFVLTVEPGIYFIPQLISNWKAENKHSEFINYNKVEEYLDFGGIRIEDDILVTEDGYRVLGKPIPKTIEEVENACKS